MEGLSGLSFERVKVHYNSPDPAQLDAKAYAQSGHIHLGPGQEQHLAHEAWHLVQQAQGRVEPTLYSASGVAINNERTLEQEASHMGDQARRYAGPIESPVAAQPVASGNTPSVVQRVYLYDGTNIVHHPGTVVPPGYLYTGQHNDGHNGPDHLYQHASVSGAATNPFLAEQGYGNSPVSMADISPQDQTAEVSASASGTHYEGKIKQRMAKRRQEWIDDGYNSSDSEDEAGPLPQHQARRRQYKASQLAAIARTMHTLSPSDAQFRLQLRQRRLRDNAARRGKRQMYDNDTRQQLAQVGRQFKQTSFAHNAYYRRAFRRAIPKAKVMAGGSANYDANQGKIRDRLLEVIAEDHKSMNWQPEDFPDAQTFQAVEFMRQNVLSNAGTGESVEERLASGQPLAGAQAKIGFHHMAWKEAGFADDALNPYNLTGLNDRRELLNPAKRRRLKDAGKPMPPVGDHDAFGHQGSGFLATDASLHRGRGGGHFKAIDHEAVEAELEQAAEPRSKKRSIYRTV